MAVTPYILFIEDDDSIQEFVRVALNDEGYEVVSASDGSVALKRIRERAPALILLDMRMPIMDGWTFLQHYQQMPLPHVPVVAMTASHNLALRPAGVRDFLAKPFDLNDLFVLVEKYLGSAAV